MAGPRFGKLARDGGAAVHCLKVILFLEPACDYRIAGPRRQRIRRPAGPENPGIRLLPATGSGLFFLGQNPAVVVIVRSRRCFLSAGRFSVGCRRGKGGGPGRVLPVRPAGSLSIVQRRWRPRLFCFRSKQVMDGQLGCPVHILGLLAALSVQLQQPGAGLGVEGSGSGSGRGRRFALPLGVMLDRGPFRESWAFRPQQGFPRAGSRRAPTITPRPPCPRFPGRGQSQGLL